MKIKLSEIERDNKIYPRQQISQKIIDSYVEALRAGAKFPPIVVQKIKDGEKVRIIVLDGYHRLEAHREYKKLEGVEHVNDVEVTFWKDQILDKKEHFEELLAESANLNRKHGLRLDDDDLKSVCEKIIENRPIEKLVGIQKELAKRFGVSAAWISKNVGEKVSSRKRERDMQIYTMAKKGNTHSDIAKKTGISKSAVTKVVKKFTNQESVQVTYDRKLADFWMSLNFIETFYIGIVAKLDLLGWEREEIVAHLKLKELSELLGEPYEGIFEKIPEVKRLIREGCELLESNGMKIGNSVFEITEKMNILRKARLCEIERETLTALKEYNPD